MHTNSIGRHRATAKPARAGLHRAFTISVLLLAGMSGGCAVVAVADAAVAVGATVVKAGAAVVGGAVDIARAGVRAATDSGDPKK